MRSVSLLLFAPFCLLAPAAALESRSFDQLSAAVQDQLPEAPVPASEEADPGSRWPTASHAYFDTALVLDIRENDETNDYYPFAGAVEIEPPGGDVAGGQPEILGLKGGMASEAGHPSVFANGGDPRKFWERALKDYKALDFPRAYYGIGLVAHLTQDQAVPAHAANINHVVTFGDRFEKAIKKNLSLFSKLQGKVQTLLLGDREPYAYYQPLQDDTRAHLAEWVNPATKVPYWPPAPGAPAMGSDAAKGPWSHYPAGGDTYDLAVSPGIMDRQMLQAAVYTAGVLKAAAKRLPPVLSRLQPLRREDDRRSAVDLSFEIYDNRKGEVDLLIERPLYGLSRKAKVRTFPSGETIPSARFSLALERLPAAAKGKDLIVITATDEDGNVSTASAEVRYEDPFDPYRAR